MADNIYALFIYHNTKNGFEKWEYRKTIETGSPDLWLQQYFEKIYNYKVKGGTCIDTQVTINNLKYKCLHVVYGGGYEMALAERYKHL